MRHRNALNRLSRPSGHRKALMRNLASSLFIHGKIRTTHAKAKALRPFAERLVTLARRGDQHARRLAFARRRGAGTASARSNPLSVNPPTDNTPARNNSRREIIPLWWSHLNIRRLSKCHD